MSLNIQEFFDEKNELISEVVSYHLLIEALLERLLVVNLAEPSALDLDRLMFARKLAMVRALGLVQAPLFILMKKLNTLRNNFAHQLRFSPTFAEIHSLVVEAGRAGVDFSDGVDCPDIEDARSLNYDEAMLLNALFRNVSFDLATAQDEAFWQDIIS